MNLSILRLGRRLALGLATVALAVAAPMAFAQVSDLSLLKYGPDTSAAGVNITYNAILLNVGPDAVANIALTDPLPPGTTFVSFAQTTGPAMTCTTPTVGSGGSVDCTLAALAVGASLTYNLTVNIPSGTPPGTSLMSIAMVSITETGFDPDEENDAGVAGTYVIGAESADLSISKLAPPSVAPGTDFKYTITVANAGPNAASAANFSDTLPAGVSFVSLQQLSGPAFTCAVPAVGSGGTVSCDLTSFALGSAVFELTVHLGNGTPAGTQINNTVTVGSSTFDPDTDNNFASALTRTGSADVTLAKTGPATVARGSTISFLLTVANNGPDTAINTTIIDALPTGTTFVSWLQNNGPLMSCGTPAVGVTGLVTCMSPALGSGASAQFTLTVMTAVAGSATSTATAVAEISDPNPSGAYSATATATTAVLAPPAVSMAFAPPVVAPGQPSMLSVTLTNPAINSVALTGVGLGNVLPAGLTVANASVAACGGTVTTTAPDTIALSGATITVGSACVFTVSVTVASAGNYNSTTTPVTSGNGGTGTTASASLVAAVTPVIAQTIVPGTILTGSNTTVTFTLSNPNPVALPGVGFSDSLPAGLIVANVPMVTNSCGGTVTANASGSSLSLAGATLAANAVCTISVQLQGAAPGTWFNSATVNATGVGTGNTATAMVIVYTVVPTLQDSSVWLLAGLMLLVGVGFARHATRRA